MPGRPSTPKSSVRSGQPTVILTADQDVAAAILEARFPTP